MFPVAPPRLRTHRLHDKQLLLPLSRNVSSVIYLQDSSSKEPTSDLVFPRNTLHRKHSTSRWLRIEGRNLSQVLRVISSESSTMDWTRPLCWSSLLRILIDDRHSLNLQTWAHEQGIVVWFQECELLNCKIVRGVASLWNRVTVPAVDTRLCSLKMWLSPLFASYSRNWQTCRWCVNSSCKFLLVLLSRLPFVYEKLVLLPGAVPRHFKRGTCATVKARMCLFFKCFCAFRSSQSSS